MLTPDDFEMYEKSLQKELVRRDGLGDYNTDAPSIRLLYKVIYETLRHMRETSPKRK
jgi:hypothetical protein